MAASEVEPDILGVDRPTRGWIVAPQYTLGEKEFRYMWDDLVVRMGLGSSIKKKAYNTRTGEMYIEMPNGSRVDVKSAEHPDGLVGEGLDWVIMSEAAKLPANIWEKYIRPALADRHGRAIFPTTPEGFNWFYELYQLGLGGNDEWKSWQYPSWENPIVYPGGFDDLEIQSQLRTPDDPWFWQELGADFRAVVGLVFGEFEDNTHIKPWVYDPNLPNYMAFDLGYSNPFVALDIQVTPSDGIRIWREHYVREKTTADHASILNSRVDPPGYHRLWGSSDSADPESNETLGRQVCPIIAKDEAKEWKQGIEKVKDFLARPGGIQIDPSCVNTIKEFNTYKLKSPARNADTRTNRKEEPEKREDHAMDALRYFIMHKFVLGSDSHIEPFMLSLAKDDIEGGHVPMDDLEGLVGVDGIFTRGMVL